MAKLPFITFFVASITAFPLILQASSTGRKVGLIAALLLLLPPALWYLRVIPEWQNDGLKGGLFATQNSLSQLTGIATHHLISTLPELIVNYASVLALIAGIGAGAKALFGKQFLSLEKRALLMALIASLLYVVYELGMIRKEHDYYLFPLVPFIMLTVVAGYKTLLRLPFSGVGKKLLRVLAIVGLVVSPLTAWLRVQSRWNLEDPGFNADYYRYKKELRAAIPENALVITGPDASQFIHLYYLNRKGWTFTQSPLSTSFVQDKKVKGAQFLVTDTANATQMIPATVPMRRFGSLVVAALP